MDIHLENTVSARFFAPAENALFSSGNTRLCGAYSDLDHLRSGVGRVLENVKSGRDWIQQAKLLLGKSIKVGQFFDSLKSPRRLDLLEDINEKLARQCDGIGGDPFVGHQELEDFALFAADGHYHACSAHEDEIEGKRRPVGHFFSMNLRSQAFHHLDTARPDIAKKMKREHDIKVMKRVKPEKLRFSTPKGKKVILVYDRAVIDFIQWYKWKQSKGIYIVTREKENMRLEVIAEPKVDSSDPRNAGVVADQFMQTSNNVMVRRVIYIDPVDGREYRFLTNEINIPPGLVAYLYKRRWDIEKAFDEKKNKLDEKKAWGKSDTAKCQQALFMCIAHNLMLLFEYLLKEEEGIEDRIAEKRRQKRKDEDAAAADLGRRKMPPMLKTLCKRVQRSLQFIRWLRTEFIMATSWKAAMDRLRPLMGGYLS